MIETSRDAKGAGCAVDLGWLALVLGCLYYLVGPIFLRPQRVVIPVTLHELGWDALLVSPPLLLGAWAVVLALRAWRREGLRGPLAWGGVPAVLGMAAAIGCLWWVAHDRPWAPVSWNFYYVSLPTGGRVTYAFRLSDTGGEEISWTWVKPTGETLSHTWEEEEFIHEDVEFRLREDGRALWAVAYNTEGDPRVRSALDLGAGEGWADVPSRELPSGASAIGGKPLARWFLLTHPYKPRSGPQVYIHWSPQFDQTAMRPKPLVPGEKYALVIESSAPFYRAAELREPALVGESERDNVAVVECRPDQPARVRATVDVGKREFTDESRYVWRYGEKAGDPVVRSAQPVAAYPAWAVRAGQDRGYILARKSCPE